ncbi:MAG TPA: hypothetical protein VF077_08775 [Nitrospiraceae bacterium]
MKRALVAVHRRLREVMIDRFGTSWELLMGTIKEMWIGVMSGSTFVVTGLVGTPQTFLDANNSGIAMAPADGQYNTIWCNGRHRLKLEFYSQWVDATASATVTFALFEDAVEVGRWAQLHSTQASSLPEAFIMYRTPAAGFHTYIIKVWKSGGTVQIVLTGNGQARTQLRISRG